MYKVFSLKEGDTALYSYVLGILHRDIGDNEYLLQYETGKEISITKKAKENGLGIFVLPNENALHAFIKEEKIVQISTKFRIYEVKVSGIKFDTHNLIHFHKRNPRYKSNVYSKHGLLEINEHDQEYLKHIELWEKVTPIEDVTELFFPNSYFPQSVKKIMTKKEIGNLIGDFTWCWGCDFFIETSEGNFWWKDPEYHGDNSLRKINCSYKEFLRDVVKVSFGRDKGKHKISSFCGDFILKS